MQLLIIILALIVAVSSLALSFYALRKTAKTKQGIRSLTLKISSLEEKLGGVLWEESEPHIKHSYTQSKSREHCFEIEVINTLSEPINLKEVFAYPPDGKITFAEISFPQEKDASGMMRVERMNYADKMTVEKAKASLGADLSPNQKCIFRYTLKFKDAVIASRRPDLYLCYQSKKRPDIREIKISDAPAAKSMVQPLAMKKAAAPLVTPKARMKLA